VPASLRKVNSFIALSTVKQLASPLRETDMPYWITQCYLPPSRGEIPAWSRYSIKRPRRDARLSWPLLRDSVPARNWTRDLSVASPTPYRNATTQHVSHPLFQFADITDSLLSIAALFSRFYNHRIVRYRPELFRWLMSCKMNCEVSHAVCYWNRQQL